MSLISLDQGRQALLHHLNTTTLSECLSPGRQSVLTLEHNQSIGEALKALAKRKVLSAPLVVAPALEDLEASEPAEPSLIGWVDLPDVLRGLLLHLKEKHKRLPGNMLLLMTELETEGKLFSRKPLITLNGGDDRTLLYSTEANVTLMQAIREQLLGGPNHLGRVVHRIAIFDDHGTITNVVSQLDIIRHLCSHSDVLLGPLGETPIQDLGLPVTRAPLVAVDPNVPTLLAYDHMLGAGVSGAPVVNGKGEMVANLSVSDLRCIQPEHLGVLALPVAEFLALLHRTTYLGYSQGCSSSKEHPFFAGSPRARPPMMDMAAAMSAGSPAPPPAEDDEVRLISVRPTSTLNEVLHMMADNLIHRVYVIDPDLAPGSQLQGVITPTDVLRWAVDMPAPPRAASPPHRVFSGVPANLPTFVQPPPSSPGSNVMVS